MFIQFLGALSKKKNTKYEYKIRCESACSFITREEIIIIIIKYNFKRLTNTIKIKLI
jgi:hypothetical protein